MNKNKIAQNQTITKLKTFSNLLNTDSILLHDFCKKTNKNFGVDKYHGICQARHFVEVLLFVLAVDSVKATSLYVYG